MIPFGTYTIYFKELDTIIRNKTIKNNEIQIQKFSYVIYYTSVQTIFIHNIFIPCLFLFVTLQNEFQREF